MTDILDTIKKRRSIRRFRPDPVPAEVLRQLVEAACWAPSAGNLQPWRFYVVTDPAAKQALAAAAAQEFVAMAPAVIVVCAVPERSASRYRDRGRLLYCLQDTAAAAQNLLLAATAMDLGACWVGAFREDEVARGLGLPPGERPVVLVPVGYPAASPQPPRRRSLEEVVSWV